MIRRLSRSLATSAATLALATALAGPVGAQGVPTVDTQNIAQEIRQLQQMLQDFGIQTDLLDNALEQLQVVQDQLDQLQEMYASLTGPRSILGMVMGDGLDGLLEAKFSDLPGLIRGIQTGDWSNLLGITAGPMRTQMEQALASAGFDEDSLREIATSGNPGAEGVATRATTGAVMSAAAQNSHAEAAQSLERVERLVADTETEAHLKRLKEIIRASGAKGITKSEITRASQWLKSRDRDEILLTLIESGDITTGMRGSSTKQAMVYRMARWDG